jgi:hypothetical protein
VQPYRDFEPYRDEREYHRLTRDLFSPNV